MSGANTQSSPGKRFGFTQDQGIRFIEEHRDALHREFCSALEKTLEILSDRQDEAVGLAKSFHKRFPADNRVARAYVDLLLRLGMRDEALSVYPEFRNRLWREHRKKADFQVE